MGHTFIVFVALLNNAILFYWFLIKDEGLLYNVHVPRPTLEPCSTYQWQNANQCVIRSGWVRKNVGNLVQNLLYEYFKNPETSTVPSPMYIKRIVAQPCLSIDDAINSQNIWRNRKRSSDQIQIRIIFTLCLHSYLHLIFTLLPYIFPICIASSFTQRYKTNLIKFGSLILYFSPIF